MKKLTWLLSTCLLLCAGAGRLQAQTASFNFSAAPTSIAGWTNLSGDPSLSIRTATDAATGIGVSSIATANWHPYNGGSSFDGLGASNGSFFPSTVMVNHWFQYDGTVSTYNPALPQLQLTGLKPNALYTLRMAGSSTSGLNSTTRYTIAGNTVYAYLDVNNHNNTADGAVFNNVAPDSTGKIRIFVNVLSTSDVGDISGLQVSQATTFSDGITRTGNNLIVGGNTAKAGQLKFISELPQKKYATMGWTGGTLKLQALDTTFPGNQIGNTIQMYPDKSESILTMGSAYGNFGYSGLNAYAWSGSGQLDIACGGTDINGSYENDISITSSDIIFWGYPNNSNGDSVLVTNEDGVLMQRYGVSTVYSEGHVQGLSRPQWAKIQATPNGDSLFLKTQETADGTFSYLSMVTGAINMLVSDGNINMGAQTISANGNLVANSALIVPNLPYIASTDSVLTFDPITKRVSKTRLSVNAGNVWGLGGNAGTNPASQYIGTNDAQPLTFRTNGTERFRVDAAGNIGIGITNPSSKLTVNGDILAKKVKVTPSGWPDYVFEKKYQLPTLTEVAQYIEKNRHLPGIISEKEVEHAGLDLGENQAALLKKVEELTLYMIELNKKVDRLVRENETLKKGRPHINSYKTK